ncbi:MAG: beta-L-arabinofuranosidase domain-containing protein, partial [Burkholderiales bacterium]
MWIKGNRKSAHCITVAIAIWGCVQGAFGLATEPALIKQPNCERAAGTDFALSGIAASYLRSVTRQWLLVAPDANPAMLEMFRDRDRQPLRAMEPWAGEFAGKYLTGAVQVYRVTHDEALRAYLSQFVQELCSLQAEDGYLGPWPNTSRLTGTAPNVGKGTAGPTWDAWGHYHIMVGLLAWSAETGDQQALQTASRIGDLFCQRFLGNQKPRLVDTGSTEMNLAPAHSLCVLYRATGESRYLELAKQIATEFAARDDSGKPLAGDYINAAAISQEFFQAPKPRWESLHPILGLTELYYLTGDDRYREAFEQWWWSIVKLDRHNNGGFSSGEQAQGNPYHQGAIETCCTIAWMTMTAEMLKLTGNSIVADELELSTFNSALGMHSPTGRWVTYNTPMEGVRRASAHEIVFQSREGTPELNCCSVNSARGLGLLSEWAVMRDSHGLILNWFGPGKVTTQLTDGRKLSLQLTTDYPRDGHVEIKVL